jgi:hypothetical protein
MTAPASWDDANFILAVCSRTVCNYSLPNQCVYAIFFTVAFSQGIQRSKGTQRCDYRADTKPSTRLEHLKLELEPAGPGGTVIGKWALVVVTKHDAWAAS